MNKDGPMHLYRAIFVPSCCNSEYFLAGLGITRGVEVGLFFEDFDRRRQSAKKLTNTGYESELRQKNITAERE